MSDIHELFSRDPLELTNDDISAIVEKMRESRSSFALGNMKAGTTKAVKVKPEIEKLATDTGFKLEI